MINHDQNQVQKRIQTSKWERMHKMKAIGITLGVILILWGLGANYLEEGHLVECIAACVCGGIGILLALCSQALGQFNANFTLRNECDPQAFFQIAKKPDSPKYAFHNRLVEMQFFFYSGNFENSAQICRQLLESPKLSWKNQMVVRQIQMFSYFFDGKMDRSLAAADNLAQEIAAQKSQGSSRQKKAAARWERLFVPDMAYLRHYVNGEYQQAIDAIIPQSSLYQAMQIANATINQQTPPAQTTTSDIREVRISYMLALAHRMLKQEEKSKLYCRQIQQLDNKTIFSKMSKILLEEH